MEQTTPLDEVMMQAHITVTLREADAYDGEMTYTHLALLREFLMSDAIGDAYERIAEDKANG